MTRQKNLIINILNITIMKKNTFGSLLALTAIAMLMSCEKANYFEEDESPDASVGNLLVRTAAKVDGNASGDDYVNYPVSIYAMNEEGKCIALQEITSSTEEINMELEAGAYDIYAITGGENYNLPTKDTATKSTTIEKKDGKSHGDLMTAYNSIVMTVGEENKLTLQMQRRVMQVQTITLNNIPSDVTAVQLTISPLYSGIKLNGDYTDGVGSHTFELVKQADGTTWKNASSEYLLEAQNAVTLKVSLIRADGTTSYSYASKEQLSANYKVNITGNFIDDEHIKLSGTIKGTDWKGTIDMTFDFDSTNITTSSGNDDDNEESTLHGNAPSEGSLYKGCYVMRTTSNGNSTTVTLMTPTEANKLKFSSSKDEETVQQSIKEAAAEAINGIAVTDITGWRLPTQEEMEYLYNNIDKINESINALNADGLTDITIKSSGYTCGYFFTDVDGNVYVYTLDGNINKTPNPNRATYKVRGFTTVTFSD